MSVDKVIGYRIADPEARKARIEELINTTGDIFCIEYDYFEPVYRALLESPWRERIILILSCSIHVSKEVLEELFDTKPELSDFRYEVLTAPQCPCCGRHVTNGLMRDYRRNAGIISSYNVCSDCAWLEDNAFYNLYNLQFSDQTKKRVILDYILWAPE